MRIRRRSTHLAAMGSIWRCRNTFGLLAVDNLFLNEDNSLLVLLKDGKRDKVIHLEARGCPS
jgi:hypothetical protein